MQKATFIVALLSMIMMTVIVMAVLIFNAPNAFASNNLSGLAALSILIEAIILGAGCALGWEV